jgi:DNA-binding MarR family transcriptional regulator
MKESKVSTKPGVRAGQLAFLVAQVGGLAAMAFTERLAPLGLGPAHAGLIRAVGATPGRSQQALATQLGILPSRLVVLIDELESDGLIERRRDPADRRYYALHLTSAGDERLRDIGRATQSHGEDFLAPLNGQDRADLTRLLTRVAAHHSLTPGAHPGYRTIGRDTELRG